MRRSENNHIWQTECKITPLALVQLCEYTHTHTNFGSFAATSRLYAKFDCPVARQKVSLLATAHDCEGLYYRNI